MAEGNRKDPRARVLNMTVRYKSATVDEFIENHSHDISRGGIFIKTRSPFPAGTLLKFEVRIAEDQKLMHGVGRVVWRREADRAEESFPAGMGIKFIKTGEGATDLINQLVAAREGVESSFDAGVRENVGSPSGARPSGVPSAPTKSGTVPPTSGPFLSVDSARGVAADGAETAVTNPAKKRPDLAPEKRKVVLQGPALESPAQAAVAPAASDSAPARERDRGSIAEETTARRKRPRSSAGQNPNIGGLVVILALVGLVVFVINRMRGPGAEPEPTPTVNAEPAPLPAPPAPPPADEAARPSEDPAVGTTAPAAAETALTGTTAEPSAAAPVDPNAPSAPSSGGLRAEGAAPTPAPEPPAPAVPPPPAATAPPPPAAVTPPAITPPPAPKAATPAPKPVPPRAKPVPKPQATAPLPPPRPAEPTPPPASDTAKPNEPTPAPPATAGSGETSGATPPRAKKPAPAEPTPAPATPPANDNPY